MGTDKPRISTVARLAERVAHLELALAEAAVPEHDPVDRVSAEATDRPDYGAIAISPNGSTLYQSYLAFDQPWQTSTANPRAKC